MVGTKTGIGTRINKIELHAHLTHCHGHTLQLTVGDPIKAIKTRDNVLLDPRQRLINHLNNLL